MKVRVKVFEFFRKTLCIRTIIFIQTIFPNIITYLGNANIDVICQTKKIVKHRFYFIKCLTLTAQPHQKIRF